MELVVVVAVAVVDVVVVVVWIPLNTGAPVCAASPNVLGCSRQSEVV